jgi:ATP-dependent RNA helicase DDX54/DBP10
MLLLLLPQDDSLDLPKAIQANISTGLIHLWGLDIPLPIRGTGYFEVVYLDDRLRVFKSKGALAVQVKQEYLQKQGLI